MGVVIKNTGNIKNINKLKAHVKYVGFRSQEKMEQKGQFFGRTEDKVNYKDFVTRVESNKAIKHHNAVKAHKLVFSLKEKDYEAYTRSGKDYKDLIRETLRDMEEKKGVKLDWIANIHYEKGHPHAHVIIKAVSDDLNKDGKYTRVFLKKDDYKDMRETFNKEFDRSAEYKPFERVELDTTMNDIAKGFEQVTKSLERELDKEAYIAEQKKIRTNNKRARENEKKNERER